MVTMWWSFPSHVKIGRVSIQCFRDCFCNERYCCVLYYTYRLCLQMENCGLFHAGAGHQWPSESTHCSLIGPCYDTAYHTLWIQLQYVVMTVIMSVAEDGDCDKHWTATPSSLAWWLGETTLHSYLTPID
jgi:hypothetical protein